MNAILYNYEFSDYNNTSFDINKIPVEDMLKYLKDNSLETYNKIDKNNARRVVNAYKYFICEKNKSLVKNNKANKFTINIIHI